MTDQDSRDWIKQRMAILKKKAGVAFNQDIFISILLCLVSGKNKHLILTAPSHRLHLVAQMATEICRCLFGFTTANVTCQQDQTVMDFVHSLFTSYDDDERYSTHYDLDKARTHHNRRHPPYNSSHHDPLLIHHKKSSSRLSNTTTNTMKDTIASSSSSPISPVDFTVRGGTGPLSTTHGGSTGHHRSLADRHTSYHTRSIPPTTTSEQHQQYRPPGSSLFGGAGDRKRFTSSALSGPPLTLSDTTAMTHRLAQVLIVQQLDQANELVQAALLELIVTKEIRMTNVRYNTPKPYFLTISVLPETGYHQTLSSPLLDHFFISYHCRDDLFSSPSNGTPLQDDLAPPPPPPRRTALLRSDEIKTLADQASQVHINIDITRYIRDIVVGVRTHPLVSGGLTARTSQDLVTVTKSLAALFRRNFLTPDLVAVAVEKVVGHRLRLDSSKGQPAVSDIVAEILRIVYAPV